MNIALVDLPEPRIRLFPFTLTRPLGHLRVGILTIAEKWKHYLGEEIDCISTEVINKKFRKTSGDYELAVSGNVIPNRQLVEAIKKLDNGQALFSDDEFLAVRIDFARIEEITTADFSERIAYSGEVSMINRPQDLFLSNSEQIKNDFELLTKNRKSEAIVDPHTIVYGAENLFIEKGVKLRAATLNAESGPIYLAKGSEIQEGAVIRGPFYLGENSRININAKVREGTTIGPNCKVGGEISNSIIFGNSNKAHGGFLGNSVIGEFCNLGAATNNSNLKNNYGEVNVWDYAQDDLSGTGLQFCGLMMGDHSKSAIGTTFNTGTVVGVASNVFGHGYPRKFVPSFTWGGIGDIVEHKLEKAIQTAQNVIPRKNGEFAPEDKEILKEVFEYSKKYRQ